ncbi:MAG: hypothetical protein JWP59_4037 [Massilia sp.]|jgi:hypothetical protein|nr:hypothetical protein [Massilia sp.]
MKILDTLTVISLSLLLAACGGKGLDLPLQTGQGSETYNVSLAKAAKDMTEENAQDFTWAVSDLSIDMLNQKYPNATPRSIIRGEAKSVRDRAPKRIAELEAIKPKYDAMLADIAKLTMGDIEFAMERDFHGLQPTVRANVANNSRLPVSQLQWRASLFLDDAKAPVATANLTDSYNNDFRGSGFLGGQAKIEAGGLPPGGAAKRSFHIGFVTADANWTTLEIQHAKVRRVVLEPVPESVKDYGGHFYLDGAPYAALEQVKNALAKAEKLSTY